MQSPEPPKFTQLKSSVSSFLFSVFGHVDWQPPLWIPWLGRQSTQTVTHAKAHPRQAIAIAASFAIAAASLVFYETRPTPQYISVTVTAPPVTLYDDQGKAQINPLLIQFSESAAPLQQVDKRVTPGRDLSPAIPGVWFWVDDKQLKFTPKNDWPIDGDFTVRLARKGVLAAGVELEDYKLRFHSQSFSARISESQFYQDPTDPNLKKLVATVAFTRPVDPAQFEKRISLAFAKDATYLGLNPNATTPDGRNFTVVYDKLKLFARIHSAPLAMPRDDTGMTVKIDSGVRAALGGNATDSPSPPP